MCVSKKTDGGEKGFEKFKQIRLAPIDKAELALLAVEGAQQKKETQNFKEKQNE